MGDPIFGIEPQWFWLGLGAILCGAEIVAPGVFLIWLGLAALITGAAAFVLPISAAMQIGLFSLLAIATVYAARRWIRSNPIVSEDPLLNHRGARLAGEIVTVVEAFAQGSGRVKVGDSVWSAKGPDAPVGTKMRVTGADGAVLDVEAL